MSFFQGALPKTALARACRMAGFSLMELVITLAIFAVLAAIAIPSMTTLMNANRLSGATNEMIATLQLARMEAVRLNAPVTVCRSDDGATCKSGELWSTWIMLADADRDGVVDDVLRVSTAAAPLEVRASAAIQDSQLSFRSDGLAKAANGSPLFARLAICQQVTQPAENERLITLAAGSRISSEPIVAAGKCATPTNS
ncbi:GspH/FimT family pseudopilin [Lysobacter sp.]|uniref:GspH/FimT family pseudopilin n=1 Tax=Lysobacter sp. TaxID=72226 RepID=UPI002D3546BB|nr:GspH/FimT family pseudopilin [Lysobacter sp.]HZX78204.1 GspH/FimT family pseudopilin [Lysobacter sp.]